MSARPHCVVIGAGPGIGQAVALAFAYEGFNVSLMSRRPEKLAEACATIRQKTGRHADSHRCDASSEASVRSALAHARKQLGDPEVLVFNAVTHAMGRPTTIPLDRLIAEFQANVGGALVAAKDVAPAMRAKKRGTILFTGGGFAHEPAADFASLSLDKAALRSLTYTLAQELGADGIHVATVTVYGFVQTGTKFDPNRIAHCFINLHRQPKGHFDTEMVYK
jgi:short-subunit dehydrogenase